ncbi:TonB-dependent receptor [Kordiimonas aestuarii]|uniref:TonB-dependent receptor n=1 Tax=Kordiimonas aestuarii TaxID=1005925 RepID=UPI0021D0DF15|nr:TonB-dependent receptor [Kordiimonas aestuarii]
MQKSIFRKTSLLSAVSTIGITASFMGMGASGAIAQDSAAQDTEMVLEEIIVTAGRREQSLQDVPAAVSAIDPGDFTVKGLKQVGEILNYTPGVTYTDIGTKGFGNISARGVPQSSSIPVFGVYLDDTPISTNSTFSGGSTVMFDAMLMDIERVEVIKGPQGTLYGATSVGGMMRYISRDPAMEELRVTAGADVATTKDGEISQVYNGRVSVPLVKDKLGITVSGFWQDIGGYVDQVNPATGALIAEDVDGSENLGYAADLLFTPTEELSIRLKYMKQETDYGIDSGVQLLTYTSDESMFGGYTTIGAPGENYLDYEIMSGSINYEFDSVTLTSTSSRVEYKFGGVSDLTAAYGPVVDFYDGRDPGTTTSVLLDLLAGSEKFVQEVRLTSERMGNFEWIAGLYYSEEDTINNQDVISTPAFDLLTIAFPSNYKEFAGFGDVTYYFNEKFDVTAGVRLSKNKTTLSYVSTGLLLGDAVFESDPIKDTVDTYLFSARYRPTDNLSLYTRVASGYRPASANIPILDPATGDNLAPPMIDPDNAWSYEIGAKGATNGNVFSYDVALWMIDWANFQAFTSFSGVNTGGNATGGLSAHGFEGSFNLRPTDALTLTTNVTYSRSKLNEDEPGIGGVEGEQLPDLPKWKGSFRADYLFDVTDSWSGNAGFGVRYSGKFMSSYSASTSTYPVVVEARTLVDANLSFTNDNVTIGLYATNLFNKRALQGRVDTILGGGSSNSTGVFERPRTIGANLRVDF